MTERKVTPIVGVKQVGNFFEKEGINLTLHIQEALVARLEQEVTRTTKDNKRVLITLIIYLYYNLAKFSRKN